MTVHHIIEWFSRDLVLEYCHGLQSSTVYTAPPFFVESLHGCLNRSLPHLLLHIPVVEMIPTFLMSNIYIGLSLPKALTLTQLWSYEVFEVLRIVRINKSVGHWGFLNFPMASDAFAYRLARGIPLKEGIP